LGRTGGSQEKKRRRGGNKKKHFKLGVELGEKRQLVGGAPNELGKKDQKQKGWKGGKKNFQRQGQTGDWEVVAPRGSEKKIG